jgi:hypothetical protein
MTLGDWTLAVTGEVVRIDRENIDKSGRNPRHVLTFVVRPEALDAPAEATLPAELGIRCSEIDLARLTAMAPEVGDRVELKARANGPQPSTLYLTEIRIAR